MSIGHWNDDVTSVTQMEAYNINVLILINQIKIEITKALNCTNKEIFQLALLICKVKIKY